MHWKRPSFFGFLMQGILLAFFVVYFVNNYNVLSKKDIMLYILLLSIAIGLHSIIHDREERYYGFNPLENIV